MVCESSEDDDRAAVEPDDEQERLPGPATDGPPRHHECRAESADGRRRAQQAEARRPDLEDVLREHGKQRDRPTEQDSEQVERDGAEQHRRAANEAHSTEHAREIGRRAPDRVTPSPQEQRRKQRDHGEPGRNPVDQLGVQREQEAADRRADDHRGLEDDRAEGERPDEDLAGHEGRRQGTRCRCSERRRDPRGEREQEERPCLVRAGARDAEQPEHDHDLERDGDRKQRASRKAVGEVSCREREERQRNEHREPDQPEVERIAPHGVHLPADRDERHLDREARREQDAEVENEVAVPER